MGIRVSDPRSAHPVPPGGVGRAANEYEQRDNGGLFRRENGRKEEKTGEGKVESPLSQSQFCSGPSIMKKHRKRMAQGYHFVRLDVLVISGGHLRVGQ